MKVEEKTKVGGEKRGEDCGRKRNVEGRNRGTGRGKGDKKGKGDSGGKKDRKME